MRTLADAGIPVGLSAAPMIPALNDSELPAILTAGMRTWLRGWRNFRR